MKKLLFLIAAIGFAFSLNAQQISVRQHDAPASTQKQSIEKMDVKLTAKPANILNANVADIQKSSKSTNAPVYTYVGQLSSASFAAKEMGKQPERGNPTILFPDSMAFPYVYVEDEPDSSYQRLASMAMGFAFDPYSTSFDYSGDGWGLFSHTDTLYGYKVDTVIVLADYRIANYNLASPDTLRFYAFTLDAVYPMSNYVREYYPLEITFQGITQKRHAIGPIVNYTNPIPQKGNAVTPKAGDLIQWDYILSTDDSAYMPDPTLVASRPLTTIIPNGGCEVAPGSLFVLMVKFIPGYDYDLNDTLSIQTSNLTEEKWKAEEIRKNRFGLWYWQIPDENSNRDELFYYWDLYGYNTHLMETKNIRHAKDTTDYGYGTFYSSLSAYKAMVYFSLHQSDEYVVVDSASRIMTIEPSELISGVYPNPATSQLTIDLKEEGQANVAIYNILGQALIQENVYDMSNTINISGLSQGMYVVKVTQNGKVNTVKFSKQ